MAQTCYTDGMSRTRISTTVDAERLAQCRDAVGVSDSELLDRALAALLRELVGAHERRALEATPYETDPEVAWQAPPGPDLPYDGPGLGRGGAAAAACP
jgi:hypothetical protein